MIRIHVIAGLFITFLFLLQGLPVWANADAAARPINPFAGSSAVTEEGGSLFNQYCSHCHGQWAEQGEPISMFYSTVTEGRIEKGMPVWKGVLPDEVLWKIYTFLETVQTED